ncbi:hypothetical protein CR513_27662, partial [Mucuna pruriens]
MKHPPEDHSFCNIDMIEELVEEFTQLDFGSDNISPFVEIFNMFPCASLVTEEADRTKVLDPSDSGNHKQIETKTDLAHPVLTPDHRRSISDLLPPQSLPDYELKPLPDHLNYVYLDNNQHSLVIIAKNLHQEQKEKLLKVLRQHKKAIRWKLSDLLGINPSICTHKILMEEEAHPIRQQQRRLNSTILDVVKKEVTKLLVTGFIYPISDSNWVSLVQVVPKKSGMTVTKNRHAEMVPTQIQKSWRVYIDYRKLNLATHKDHFPLPFIDQVLERLAEKSHYCFLLWKMTNPNRKDWS